MERSRLALPVLVTLAAVMLLVIGGAMLLVWVLRPDTSIGDLFDRIRPYLPVQYGQTINSAPELVVGQRLFEEEAAQVCGCAVGSVKSWAHWARWHPEELLAIRSPHDISQDEIIKPVLRVA